MELPNTTDAITQPADVTVFRPLVIPDQICSKEWETQYPASDDDPSAQDIANLRRVRDSLPYSVWAASIMGMAERFAFYGASAPFQNYIQNTIDEPFHPGSLGLGQATATTINYAFLLFGFITPIPMAIITDRWLGRYKVICMCIVIELTGCLALVITSLPQTHSVGSGGLAAAMVLIGIGVGGVKTAVAPFVADQYTQTSLRLKTLKSGERVIIDRTLTMQYIYNMFYWMINVGSLAGLATTLLEKYVGFWAAYLLPFCALWISVFILVTWRIKFVHEPPQGNILPQALMAIIYACGDGFRINNAKPGPQLAKHGRTVPWDDKFIEDLNLALIACRVCLGFPIFWLCWGQAFNNLISQAGQMESYGLPNDLFKTLNPIGCIIFGPVVQNILYPYLNRWKIEFPPIARIATGFVFMAISIAIAAGIQDLIYTSGPCYNMPLTCAISEGGTIPNTVNVFIQTPIYIIMAFSELFALATGYEYAYTKAPQRMKSFVQAISVFMAGIGSALGMAISTVDYDPHLTTLYTSLTVVMVVNAIAFWFSFRKLDKIDDALNNAVINGDQNEQS